MGMTPKTSFGDLVAIFFPYNISSTKRREQQQKLQCSLL